MAMATSTGALAPMDGTVYLQNATDPSMQGWQNSTFGQGDQIGTSGWYCVYNGLGSGLGGGGVQIGGLQPGTNYRVMVVSYNGYYTGTPTYLMATTWSNPATWPIPKPTVQASWVAAYLPDGAANPSVAWISGNGEATAVFMAAATSGAPAPVDGVSYFQNRNAPWAQGYTSSVFGQGTRIGQSDWHCVYNGPSSAEIEVTIQGLQPGTTYRIMAVSYNGLSLDSPTYLTATASGNPVNYSLSPLPVVAHVPATPPIACMVLALLLCGTGTFRIVRKRGQHAR